MHSNSYIPNTEIIYPKNNGSSYSLPEQQDLYYGEEHTESCLANTDSKGCFTSRITQEENYGVCADIAAKGERYRVRSIRYEYVTECGNPNFWLVYPSSVAIREDLPKEEQLLPHVTKGFDSVEFETKIQALVYAGRLSERHIVPVARIA